MRPFFPYYGSKWRLAKAYGEPRHNRVIEPFAGSACYSVWWDVERADLYDLDDYICAVWDYLINVGVREVLNLPDLEAYGHIDDLKITQEAKWLIGYWLNAAPSQPCKKLSSWGKIHRDKPQGGTYWGPNVRRRIANQLHMIRRWTITQASYETIDQPRATYFVDPPYQDRGKYYRHGSKSIDYSKLSEWCRGLSGQVIVCENVGAQWLPFKVIGSTKTVKHKRSIEVVWKGEKND